MYLKHNWSEIYIEPERIELDTPTNDEIESKTFEIISGNIVF